MRWITYEPSNLESSKPTDLTFFYISIRVYYMYLGIFLEQNFFEYFFCYSKRREVQQIGKPVVLVLEMAQLSLLGFISNQKFPFKVHFEIPKNKNPKKKSIQLLE